MFNKTSLYFYFLLFFTFLCFFIFSLPKLPYFSIYTINKTFSLEEEEAQNGEETWVKKWGNLSPKLRGVSPDFYFRFGGKKPLGILANIAYIRLH